MVVQQVTKDVEFHADGTWIIEETTKIRIQSEASVRQLGILSFPYDKRKQNVKITFVHVEKGDGTTVSTPEADVLDVSSEVSRVAPTYSDLREKQVPVKSLNPGDTLEFQVVTTRTEPDIRGQFWYSANFLSGIVVLNETLHVSVPADKYVKVTSATVQPTTKEEGRRNEYFWSSSQLETSVEQQERAKKWRKRSS